MKQTVITLLLLLGTASTYAQKYEWALMGIQGIGQFHDGLAIATQRIAPAKYVYGAIDRTGQTVIPFKFKEIKEVYGGFTSGYCAACTEEGYGIIDRRGNFVLGPSSKFDIRREEKHPEIFIVEDKEKGKKALFHKGFLLTDFEWDYIYESYYPFISLSTHGATTKNTVINAITGDVFEGWSGYSTGNYYMLFSKDRPKLYYTLAGERVPWASISTSTKGIEIFQDSETLKYGLRDGNTIICPAKFTSGNPAWYKDRVVLYDSELKKSYVFGGDGKVIFETNSTIYIGKNCMPYSAIDGDAKGVLTIEGKEIEALKNYNAYGLTDGWLYGADPVNGNRLYSLRSGKSYPSKFSNVNGEIIIHNDGKDYYILNPETEKFYGPYSSCGHYSDGLIFVRKGESEFFLSKNGQQYPIPKGWNIDSDGFSEGVCRATDANGVVGYIYNPLGHGDYVYNQQVVSNDKYIIQSLFSSAEEAFEKKEYGRSKDIYYHIMMADPMNMPALNSYAACLYNLGYYEEALSANELALSKEGTNAFANDLNKAIIAAIERQDAANKNEYAEVATSTSFWDALANFGKALENAANAYSGNYNGASGYSGGGSSYSTTSPIETSKSSNSSSRDYLSQYQRWERIAERHYNSITNIGASAKKNDGSKTGSAGRGVSSSNYTRMKRSYREAQREMARIRQQAARAGVTIQQSHWETNQISY